MSVEYKENESGVYWVDGDQQGEPQKNLRHAMDDYELVSSGRKGIQNADDERSVHTGDDGGPAEGQLIADNAGSDGESQDPNREGSAGETRRSGARGRGANDPNPGAGSDSSAGTDGP